MAALTRQQLPETSAENSRQPTAADQGAAHDSSASPSVADGALAASAHGRESDLQEHARDVRPRLLLAAYYSQRLDTPAEVRSGPFHLPVMLCTVMHLPIANAHVCPKIPVPHQDTLPHNVACCGGPDGSLDFDSALQAAERCFSRLFPGADAPFLSNVTPGAPCALSRLLRRIDSRSAMLLEPQHLIATV